MLSLLGNACLILALLANITGLLSKKHVKVFTYLIFIFLALSFFTLTLGYLLSDFSIKNVFENSNTLTPTIYKITGVWGNHEGSLLLYIFLLSFVTIIFGIFSNYAFKNKVIKIQFFIICLFLLYLIFASNPFIYLSELPSQGLDLNPLLQDIGIAIHPPLLYLGYTFASLSYSFAIISYKNKSEAKDFAISLRNFNLASFAFLSIGIGFGSWWAYRELGWGGYWFWDPVENSSLLAWLCSLCLIHLLKLTKVKNELSNLTLIVAILTFVSSILGFFLVRSGILASVHSFATDPLRGMVMLLILFTLSIFAFLHIKKMPSSKALILTKEGGIIIGSFFLLALFAIIFTGLFYPIFSEIFFQKAISVGVDFFNLTFNPIFLAITFGAGFFMFFAWKGENSFKEFLKIRKKVFAILAVCLFLTKLISYQTNEHEAKFLIAYFVSIFLMIAMLWKFVEKYLQHKSFAKIAPHSYATYISHFAIGLLVFSIAFLESNKSSTQLVMNVGQETKFANFNIKLAKESLIKEKNYVARIADFQISKGEDELAVLNPETRVFVSNLQKTTESSIYRNYFNDLYIVIGDKNGQSLAVKIFHEPLINLMWLSVILLFFGVMIGALSKR